MLSSDRLLRPIGNFPRDEIVHVVRLTLSDTALRFPCSLDI